MSVAQITVEVAGGFAVISALSGLLQPICRRAGQPLVVGQLLAGILLGPSGLGRLPGHLTGKIFPVSAQPYLSVIAQIGLVFFLFSVGCELDLGLLSRGARTVMGVSWAGLLLPLAAGAAIGLAMWHGWLPGAVHTKPESATVLFLAIALSITAVPVLAAILRESGLLSTLAGTVALASAGTMDVANWLLLAAALALADTGHPFRATLLYFVAYLLVMLLVVRPLLHLLLHRKQETGGRTAFLLAAALASAWATGAAGLQVIFGSMFFGALMPRGASGRCEIRAGEVAKQAGDVLLPLFFVVTGLSVNLGALRGSGFAMLALLVFVAVTSKVAGGALMAGWTRLGRRESVVIGILLSTRGLTELIAISAGREANLINAHEYTLLVLMALITTALTNPLLRLTGASRLTGPAPSTPETHPSVPERPEPPPGYYLSSCRPTHWLMNVSQVHRVLAAHLHVRITAQFRPDQLKDT